MLQHDSAEAWIKSVHRHAWCRQQLPHTIKIKIKMMAGTSRFVELALAWLWSRACHWGAGAGAGWCATSHPANSCVRPR